MDSTISREEIMRMARDAGWHDALLSVSFTQPLLEKFFHMAYEAGAKIEREACAKVCRREQRSYEHLDRNGRSRYLDYAEVAGVCAAVIESRGKNDN